MDTNILYSVNSEDSSDKKSSDTTSSDTSSEKTSPDTSNTSSVTSSETLETSSVTLSETSTDTDTDPDDVARQMRCYICHSHVDQEERYYPCNCFHSYVHKRCLSRWLLMGNRRCRICGLKYDLERCPGKCFVCKNEVLDNDPDNHPLLNPCKCKFIQVHARCINGWYNINNHNHKCKFCDYEYKVKRRVKRKFTTSRYHIGLKILLGIAYVIGLIFLFFGRTIVYPIFKINSDKNFAEISGVYGIKNTGSFLLFPGNAVSAFLIFDILFIVLGFMVLICSCIVIGKCTGENKKLNKKIKEYGLNKILLFIPLTIFTFHLMGNLHYNLWICAGIISPNAVAKFTLSIFTLIAGFAGLIYLAVLAGCLYLIYILGKGLMFLLCKKEIQIEVLSNPELNV